MTQNSNRGNPPRHPRSPLPKSTSRPQQGRSTSSALLTTPPRKPMNWLSENNTTKSASETQAALAHAEPRLVQALVAPTPLAVAAKSQAMEPVVDTSTPPMTDGGFAALGLRSEIVRAVLAHGYSKPTPIQAQAIPAVLAGGDLLGGAQTGTGKTAGFVLPLLQRLMAREGSDVRYKQRPARAPSALILAPTRELAAQVEESVRVYGKFLPLKSAVIFGGVGLNPQIAELKRGVDIVVATPGRLLDLYGQKAIDFSQIEILVLDEADRMLDMGFIHDIRKVLAVLPPKRQNLLFSATFSDDIKALADKLLNNPRAIEVARRNTTTEVVEQSIVQVEKSNKAKLLIHLVKTRQWSQVLVFTRTKHGANRLSEQLNKSGITAMAIHGNKSQSARTKALTEFKSGEVQILVATDIAARGIDIDQLPQVVNYELPNVPEDYVHRIGRTGRAGASGQAMSLVMQEELPLLRDIERFTKQSIPKIKIEGFDSTALPEPVASEADAREAEWAGGGRRGSPPRSSANRPKAAKSAQNRAPAPRGNQPRGSGHAPASGTNHKPRPAGSSTNRRAQDR